jgi:hypothetical protein
MLFEYNEVIETEASVCETARDRPSPFVTLFSRSEARHVSHLGELCESVPRSAIC